MHFYPQLSTGTICQYPLAKRRMTRVISNVMPDGSKVTQLDTSPSVEGWELSYQTLSDGERAMIESFFVARQGRLESFTLLDPTENLLTWSEDFTNSSWTIGPGLSLTGSILGPDGTNTATHLVNSAQLPQRIKQAIEVPGNFQYCFSFYAKSLQGSSFNAIRECGTIAQASHIQLTPSWKRYWVSGNLQSDESVISMGLEIEAGGQADIYGLQVDAQPAPGSYKPSRGSAGIYRNVRFAEDHLTVIQDAPDTNSLTVRLITTS